jgi:hypothetical protein
MNIKKQLLIILFGLLGLSTLAQTNKKTLNYQAVILDPKAIDIPGANITGQPLNKGNVCLRFSLLNAQGGLDYEETQSLTTDEYGLVNVAIGSGTQAQAGNSTSIYKSFESVVWNSSIKSLKVSVSYDGCSSFKQVSAQALNYIPYALYAEAVDYKNVREAPTKLSQFSNDAGYLIPKDLDPIKADIMTNTSQLATAYQTIADNKKSSDATFLVMNQSITSLDTKVAVNTTAIKENTSSITNINTKITDQQNQIFDNRNQITATNNNLNTQIGGLQGQLNTTNSTVNNLTGVAEVVSNKSTAIDLGGTNPSDQSYPSQKAAKAYVDQVVSQIATTGVPDATTLAAGKLQLAGDLGGTATSPTVPALTNKENSSNKSTNVQTDAASDTKYPSVKAVKDYVDQAVNGTALAADLANKANLASPEFTGTPKAPNPASSDNSNQIATTAFVQAATAGIALQSVVNGKADRISPIFEGTPSLPTGTTGVTQTAGDNSTKLATTAYVATAVSGNSGVPYSGAIAAVNLGNYDLTINEITVGRGRSGIASNTAIGYSSLGLNTTGYSNTAIGNSSLFSNTGGYGNTAIGLVSLHLNNTGYHNTAYGAYSLYGNKGGNANTASGYHSLSNNSTGTHNTANGYFSLSGNTTGAYNTGIGVNAGWSNYDGSFNTYVGYYAHGSAANLSNATAIGNYAQVVASNSIQLGNTSITNVKTSGTITAGSVTYPSTHGSAYQVLSTTGSGTLTWATASSGVPYTGATRAVDLGSYDLKVYDLTIGRGGGNVDGNTANGNMSLYSNSSGNSNTAYGYASLYSNTSGSSNIANGNQSLYFNTTGSNNTAIGNASLNSNIEGVDNTANGFAALYKNTGGYNTANGSRSLYSNTTGGSNTASGYSAGTTNTTGNQNTLIGHSADVSSNNLSNATALGNGALVAVSNTIQLGNTSVTNVKTSGTITAGSVTYPSAHGSANQVLSTTGSGTLTWTTPSTGGGGGSGTYTTGLNASLGGYVFFVTPDGKHGLVAAGQDQGVPSKWYGGNQDKISDPLNHDVNGKNFTDWRMPSRYELKIMFLDRINVGLKDFPANYWSSTENDSGGQFTQGVTYGSMATNKGNDGYYFRAIRSF